MLDRDLNIKDVYYISVENEKKRYITLLHLHSSRKFRTYKPYPDNERYVSY